MLQRSAFASTPIPFCQYPKNKNCRKEKQQINRREGGKGNVNHGAGWLGGALGGVTSLPQSTVATPQVSDEGSSGPGLFGSNRAAIKCWRACSSRAASPEEFR